MSVRLLLLSWCECRYGSECAVDNEDNAYWYVAEPIAPCGEEVSCLVGGYGVEQRYVEQIICVVGDDEYYVVRKSKVRNPLKALRAEL